MAAGVQVAHEDGKRKAYYCASTGPLMPVIRLYLSRDSLEQLFLVH